MITPSLGPNVFRFNLPGLAVFSTALVLTGSALTYAMRDVRLPAARMSTSDRASEPNERRERRGRSLKGPWGELLVRDIEIERPEEYIAYDGEPLTETWTFGGSTPGEARPTGNVAPIRKPLSAADEAALTQALDHVGDPGLKSALLRLGRAVKQG